jgi:hypothetical protein
MLCMGFDFVYFWCLCLVKQVESDFVFMHFNSFVEIVLCFRIFGFVIVPIQWLLLQLDDDFVSNKNLDDELPLDELFRFGSWWEQLLAILYLSCG